jgi:hypothetical protein
MKLLDRKGIFILTIMFLGQSCVENNTSKAESNNCNVTNNVENNSNIENSKSELIAQTDTLNKRKNKSKMTNQFPFKISNNAGQFTITAETESPELYPKYAELFEKFGYSGNGYCWEGHITQILEKLNPELLKHIDFDPEAGAFFAYADTKENQEKFIEILSPIFADLKKLEEYIKKADHSKIDD